MPVTRQQLKAAQALASGVSQGEAAKRAGVARATVNRWLKNKSFRDKVSELSEKSDAVATEVFVERVRKETEQTLSKDDLKVFLSEMVRNEELRPDTRLKAAAQLGKWLGLEEPANQPKPEEPFPLQEMLPEGSGEAIAFDLGKLSDEELNKMYLATLTQQ